MTADNLFDFARDVATPDVPLSWSDVAALDAAGFCPASPDYDEPHITTDGETCDECGARLTSLDEYDRAEAEAVDLSRGIGEWGEAL